MNIKVKRKNVYIIPLEMSKPASIFRFDNTFPSILENQLHPQVFRQFIYNCNRKFGIHRDIFFKLERKVKSRNCITIGFKYLLTPKQYWTKTCFDQSAILQSAIYCKDFIKYFVDRNDLNESKNLNIALKKKKRVLCDGPYVANYTQYYLEFQF